MTYILRDYQQSCLSAIYSWLKENDTSPCAVLGTGLGKSVIIAQMARDVIGWNGRCLILTHSRELVGQNADTLRQLAPDIAHHIGVYSAGLKKRDTEHSVIFASIQSVYNKAEKLGAFQIVIVDESHLLNYESDTAMYSVFLAEAKEINPACRLVGFTASPFRLSSGPIYGEGRLFGGMCFETDLKEMIAAGYLAPLTTKASKVKIDISELHTRAGEFIPAEVEQAFDKDSITAAALDEALVLAADRKHWLVFASGVNHANHICEELNKRGVPSGCITGEMPTEERDRLINAFKAGELRALVSVMVLTTGINIPAVDCIVFLRATKSAGLWLQSLGRGMRPCEGKTNCLVLDYGQNAMRFGPLDEIRAEEKIKGNGETPCKICKECQEVIPISVMVCPACGFEFPKPEERLKHDANASNAPIISTDRQSLIETWPVNLIDYMVWTKRDSLIGAPQTIRVIYTCGFRDVSEWVCFEHEGYAFNKACDWWAKRSNDSVPTTSADAVRHILNKENHFKEPTHVRVELGGKYPELIEAIFAGPCSTCKMFEAGYCHEFDSDVPAEFVKDGCVSHEAVIENATTYRPAYLVAAESDSPPF